ncbi:mannonate dehydratase [Ruania zhangjianzhongii]|uniref:mannonate dehydratase n=1 Tax=Ruania zhangjianzhongii TaxID=2603206 RepID=UPI0011C79EAC|nr:mannonate dehydratase [Ruania zhangjianzhongii]
MTIRLALGHIEALDEDVITFAQQLGLESVHLHTPTNLDDSVGYWRLDELSALRQRCEDAGLRLEAIENVPYLHWDKVLRGEPGRDEQLENYCRTIQNMADAGISTLGHHFIPGYVWRTDLRARGRGGALVTAFDIDRIGEGNKLAGYKLTPADAAEQALVDAEQMWQNYEYFLRAVLPVAEGAGVRLALHPDDPPIDVPLGGFARIMSSPEGLMKAHQIAEDSPAWALNLCLGSVSEMDGERSVNTVIDYFGPRGRIAYVHFRDVQGTVPRFAESFLGEGNYNPAAVVRRLVQRGFDGFLIDDHVPAMLGDADTWADTSTAAFCSRGRAHALGYLTGLFNALELDVNGR